MQKRVFLKIYFIWFIRRILPLIALEVLVLGIAIRTFASKVFVGKVIENAALASDANYWSFFKYLGNAFLQTHFVIQIVILALLGVGALLLRDFAKTATTYLKTVLQNRAETKNQ